MTKIAYNACHGGFSLSHEAIMRYGEIRGLTLYPEPFSGAFAGSGLKTYWIVPPEDRIPELEGEDWYQATIEERCAHNKAHAAQTIYDRDIPRNDPALIQVIEEMGAASNGAHANLKIKEIPSGSRYRIDEYDGAESVMTPDDYEWEVA